MARMCLSLFCVTLFFGQFVGSNAAGYCQERSPAVRLCNDDSGSAHTVYVDTYYVPTFENITCWCTLDIENWNNNVDLKVTRLRGYTSDIVVFINNNMVLLSSDLKTFSYTPGMAIKFELTDAQYKVQCYKFEIVSSSLTDRGITVTCTRPVNREPSTTTSASTKPKPTTNVFKTYASTNALEPSTSTKPQPTTNGLQTDATTTALETSQIPTVYRKLEPTTGGIHTTDAESNSTGTVLGAATGVVVVIAVIAVVLVIIWRRKRNVNKKLKEQEKSVAIYYNVANQAGTDGSSHNPLPSEYENIQSTSDLSPPATYESLQTHGQREDDHSYQTVIAGGDGEYVNADYEEPMTNYTSTNYATLQQPIEQEHVYKTIH